MACRRGHLKINYKLLKPACFNIAAVTSLFQHTTKPPTGAQIAVKLAAQTDLTRLLASRYKHILTSTSLLPHLSQIQIVQPTSLPGHTSMRLKATTALWCTSAITQIHYINWESWRGSPLLPAWQKGCVQVPSQNHHTWLALLEIWTIASSPLALLKIDTKTFRLIPS